LPITDERIETLEARKSYPVQYFERARFEYHPENAPPNDNPVRTIWSADRGATVGKLRAARPATMQ
jgi:hypothetical protein